MRVPGGGPVLGTVSPSVRETVNLRLPTMKEHRQNCDKEKRSTGAGLNILEDRPAVRIPARVMEMLKLLTASAAQKKKKKKKNEDSLAELSQTFEQLSVDEHGSPRTSGDDVEAPQPVMSIEQLLRLIVQLTANDKATEDLSTATSKKSDAEKTSAREDDGSDDDDDNDLCSRAPARRYNGRHVDSSPYANASHRHHSGGACTYAAIDPVAADGYEKSWYASENAQNVVNVAEMSYNISEDDIMPFLNSTPYEVIVSMVQDMYDKYCCTEEKKTKEVPQSVVEINLVSESKGDQGDVRVASSAPVVDPWLGYDSGISSSSSSPISIPASSPAGSHDYSPQSTPPDDSNQAVPCPDLHDPFTSYAGAFYSPSAATPLHQDFETLDQIASNGYMCGLDSTNVDGLDSLDEGFSQSSADDESSVFAVVPGAFAPNLDQFAGRSSQNATLQQNTFQFIVDRTDQSDFPVADSTARPTLGLLYPVIPAVCQPATATSGLKPIKPKVNRPAETSTGRDRLQKMMDEKKKAEAWSRILSKRKEAMESDQDGDTQLMILCANPKHVKDYALEYIYALVEMLKNVPNALSAVNRQNHSALYLAAVHSDFQHRAVVVRYLAETLVERGVDITQPSAGGSSLLHELCSLGDDRHDVVKELLALRDPTGKHCFNVNAYDTQGRTALHLAASHIPLIGSPSGKTVQLLIAEGADILLPDKVYGHTALHLAILNSCSTGLVQAFLSAAKSFCPPGDLAQICNSCDANRNTPLHSAASRNDVPLEQQKLMIRMLMGQAHKAGKSMNAHGKYPIMLVAEERRQEIRAVYEARREI